MEKIYTFKPERLRVPEPEPLSNTERQLLRDLAAPGLPLWKIMRQFTDYGEELKESITDPELDLEDPETRHTVRKVQNALAAIKTVLGLFEQSLSFADEPGEV